MSRSESLRDSPKGQGGQSISNRVEATTRAYDALAPRYEELQLGNTILAHVARVSQALVESAMRDCHVILELGCGTGRETLPLAAMGKRVVACDPSVESLRILASKAERLGLSNRIETRALRASETYRLESEFGPGIFHGGLSSFALSYEPDLGPIPSQLSTLIEPGGPFLCSIYNRYCLMEFLLLAPLLVPRRALRRLLGEALLPVDRFLVRVRSYTASEVRQAFAPNFRLERTWALPAVLPPNYVHRLVELLGGFRPALERLDARLNGQWPFRYLGSHTAYLFRLTMPGSQVKDASPARPAHPQSWNTS